MSLPQPITATQVPDKGHSSQIKLRVGRWERKRLCLRGESDFEFNCTPSDKSDNNFFSSHRFCLRQIYRRETNDMLYLSQ